MAFDRILERDGKTLTFTVTTERRAAEELIDATRAKLKQGWMPTAKPGAVGKFTKALEDAGLSMWAYVVALTDAELRELYAKAMRSNADISMEVFRRRPTRELFAWMLGRFADYYTDDWTKAVKFLAKTPEHASWINEELLAALENGTLTTESAKKFAARNAKKIAAGPKPTPKAPGAAKGSERDLLADVAAAPKDDAPRLVYADWLLEQGSGFGELIQLSCKLALLDYEHPDYKDLAAQVKRLEAKHAKGWLEPIRPFIRSWSFERGLLSRVVCDAALFTQAADAIALRAPRAYVELTGLKKKDIAALAKTPLGAFEHVNLDQQRIEDGGMMALAASPTIAGVSSWGLSYHPFKDDGLRAIAASPYFASAESLTLRAWQPQFSPSGLAALVASPNLPKLGELEVTATSVENAFSACRLRLKSLSLYAGAFRRQDAESLVQALGQDLEILSLNSLRREGALAIDDGDVNWLLDALPKLRSFSTNIDLRKSTEKRIEKLGAVA